MLRSFITITFRILWRNKVTTFVNIFSLSIGITSFIFIMLYVHHETGYDKFHKNYERIYRLEGDDYAKLPPVIGDHLKERVPEIQNVVHLAGIGRPDISYRPEANPEDVRFTQTYVLWADSTTFRVFTFPFLRGNPATALRNPFTAVITESTAKILFDKEDPIGRSLEFGDYQYEIRGVIQDTEKSHIEIGALLSMTSMPLVFPKRNLNVTGPNSWLWSATYLLTTDGVDEDALEKKINESLAEINDGNLFDTVFKQFHLRPMKEIYFFGALSVLDYGLHGSFRVVTILFVVGVFMLLLAGINYVNLTTARSVIRTKEVAVKRVVGSPVSLVRFQLILESVIVSLVSLVVALTLVQIFIQPFNDVAMVKINLAEWNRVEVWMVVVAGMVTLGVLAGLYPALYLTALKPARLMKGAVIGDSSSFFTRSLLMTFQFTLSVMLIICMLVNLRQLNYLRRANLGFNKDQIMQIDTPADFDQEYVLRETFKEELLQSPNILGVSYSAGSPANVIGTSKIEFEGNQSTQEFLPIDHDYLSVMGIDLVEGRGFPPKKLSDYEIITGLNSDSSTRTKNRNILLNEAFVREFNLTSPVGKILYNNTPMGRRACEVIGIVKDFNTRSLHHKIRPMFFIQPPPQHLANIKVQAADIPATIKTVEKAWKKVYGDAYFTFSFLDETFNRQYQSDEQFSTIISWFTALALVIACLGLFALSSFMIARRTKEIGIRKSMGATIRTIYAMLSWDFLRWITIAVIVACPVSWYLMKNWLNKFAYHIALGADIFIIAAALAFAIALLTITWQALKAANANPIKALRYE